MASVSLSQARREIILRNLKASFEKRIDAINNEMNSIALGDAAYNLAYSMELQAAMDKTANLAAHLSNEAFTSQSQFTVMLDSAVLPSLQRSGTVYLHLPLSFARLMVRSSYGAPAYRVRSGDADTHVITTLVDQLNKRTAIEKERDELGNSIRKILEKCTTLRQVAEVWPSVMNYIDNEMREAHNRPTGTRAKTVREQLEMDDATKLALIKANMLNNT